MTDDGASLLSRLHAEPDLASLMPIDDDNVVSINSGQAEAGEFYSDANAFFATEEDLYEELLMEVYYDLDGGAEEDEYVFSPPTHLTNTDERFYLPQYVDFILSFVVDSESIIDSYASAPSHTLCNCCENHTAKGKGKAREPKGDEDMWLLDSGASAHFTYNFDAFVEYQPYVKPHHSQMANGLAPVLGEGTILVWFNGNIVRLSPTIYMPTCTFQLVLLGTLLKNNCLYMQSAEGYMHIIDDCTKRDVISFHTHGDSTMYWIRAPPVHDIISMSIDMITIDYELLHCRLGHPSKDLRAICKHVKDFPSVTIPPVEPVCPGCQLGKQPNHPFAANETHTTKPFELIHLDLKSFETESCHRSRYIIIFYNDYTSMGWIKPLRTKDQALPATKEFIKYIQNQHSASIKGWMSDAGGEYKSKAFGQLMRDQGIHVYESAPHTPQQNGRTE